MTMTNSKNSIRIRINSDKNGEQVFKAILYHPMETGYRRDANSGENIPADYIEDFQISVDGKKYIEMVLGESMSKNPFLSFTFSKPLVANQHMEIRWVDNNNRDISYDCVIKFDQSGTFGFEGEKEGAESYPIEPAAGPACKTKTQ